jgi:hypothetical protein
MRRKDLSMWAVMLLALAFAVAFAAGCGGNGGTSTSADNGNSPAAVAQLTPQQIVDQSQQKMQAVNSAAFTADLKLALDGDASKMTDATAKQLLSSPITLHAEGSSSTKPVAADMDVTVALMGQNLAMGVLADGKKAWVQYENAWYAVPQKNTEALTTGDIGALPTEQLADLGLDPQAWNVEWELAGTETVDGAEVYHLTASPDAKKIAADLMKALNNPELYKKLGDPQTAEQVKALKTQNSKQLGELQKALKSVEVELWIEKDSLYMRKGTVAIGMDMTGMQGAEGVTAMNVDVAFTMADFNEPVEVKAPAKAQDFGGMM